jgi:hypothetical protein
MKKTLFLVAAVALSAMALFTACKGNVPEQEDLTQFSTSSIVGIWACVGSDNKTWDVMAGGFEYHWDYDPDAATYDVPWYFNIQSDSKVQYVNIMEGRRGEYRRSDGYLHLAENSKWKTLVDADYIFDVEHQAIRCTSGRMLGFKLESVKELLGSDTIFYVKRYGIDEAAIIDNTGYIKSQYVIRAKGIKMDLPDEE